MSPHLGRVALIGLPQAHIYFTPYGIFILSSFSLLQRLPLPFTVGRVMERGKGERLSLELFTNALH